MDCYPQLIPNYVAVINSLEIYHQFVVGRFYVAL